MTAPSMCRKRAQRLSIILMLQVSIVGWDGDELDPSVKLEDLIAERDYYFNALAEAAGALGTPKDEVDEMLAALHEAWGAIPAIRDLTEASLVPAEESTAQ